MFPETKITQLGDPNLSWNVSDERSLHKNAKLMIHN